MDVVISQSMYFPWVGFLEQISLADIYVRYDDVQFSKGSFTNRVQIKTSSGIRWLTVPLENRRLGQRINEVNFSSDLKWRKTHLQNLAAAYRPAPYFDEMIGLAESVIMQSEHKDLGALAFASTASLAEYYGLFGKARAINIDDFSVPGTGSSRVLEIVRMLGGTRYITGHGARNYLDHEAFEAAGIEVRYIRYSCTPYEQLDGSFTPFVTALDLVANLGRSGIRCIRPQTVNWRDFLNEA